MRDIEDLESPTLAASADWSNPLNAQSCCSFSAYPIPPTIRERSADSQEKIPAIKRNIVLESVSDRRYHSVHATQLRGMQQRLRIPICSHPPRPFENRDFALKDTLRAGR